MMIDLADTTVRAVHDALTRSREAAGGPTTGVVLNLIIVTDESAHYDAVRAATQAGREHPCRVLGVIARNPGDRSRLDAEIRTGEGAPGQTVLLRLYGQTGAHADSVVMPLLVPDTPVVTWWPGPGPAAPSRDPLGALAQRRVTDAAAARHPARALAALAASYQPGDTDLAWTRATTWRSLLAATLDQPHGSVTGGLVAAEPGNPSADLLTAWLSGRLGAPFRRDDSGGPGITEARFLTSDGDISVTRPDGRVATLSRPGQPERRVALHRRDIAELLAEELRQQGPDEGYSAALLARAVAARLVTRLVDAAAARGSASLVLTGGGIGTRVLAELAVAPARDAIDWRHLDIWWGDERFLPAGDPERNETGARAALLDHVDISPERVRPMPGPDGPDGNDPEAAAARYAGWLRAASRPEDHGQVPSFDILMLGIGPEAHVASLFPGMPALYEERTVVAVHGAPKPPPTRLTLTLPAITAAREVWIIASGDEKARAVRMALSGAGPVQVPAAGAHGRLQTLFLLDRAAAARVPPQLGRLASP